MAERSTAAVDVAETSGEDTPLTAQGGGANADGATDGHSGGDDAAADATESGASPATTAIMSTGTDTADPPAGTDAGAGVGVGNADEAASSGSRDGAERGGGAEEPQQPQQPPEPEQQSQEVQEPQQSSLSAPAPEASEQSEPAGSPELHSGHKLARRYRLEECLTRLDGFSSWRAVDEKLRRAVGVHVLPRGHARARHVLSAARSAALLGDPRFVQVLDAVEESDLVYVVHEWLPDAVPLSDLLTTGPLEPHDAYQLVSQLSQALTAAHREGLAHLQLTPATVLRTATGQYRVRGLAVNAALRGITSDTPQRADTEAIGALLYAALTQRWPYEQDAYGLSGVGAVSKGTLVAPDQVRAGVHRGLSQLAMRALVNDGATASSQEQPCATPEELSKTVATLPRIRPPETSYAAPPPYQRTTYQQGAYGAGGPQGPGGHRGHARGHAHGRVGAEPSAPPALPGRTGKVLKWGVSALLIAALGLGSWQIADTLLKGKGSSSSEPGSAQGEGDTAGKPVRIVDAKDFDPAPGGNGSENPEDVADAYDNDPGTYWLTQKYYGRPDFGNLKEGVGLILDLGKVQEVKSLKVDFMGATSAGFLAAPEGTGTMPTSLSGFSKVTNGTGEHLTLKAKKPVKTQYVLMWLTKLPLSDDGNYRGRVTQVQVLS